MSDNAAALVEAFLTCNGEAFLCPEYQIWDGEKGRKQWSCPDFVVLDFSRRDVVVVEVTSDASLKRLLERVINREKQWFSPLRQRLLQNNVIDAHWKMRFLDFVREDLVKKANDSAGAIDTLFYPLEEAAFPHLYWDQRMRGLPRNAPSGDLS